MFRRKWLAPLKARPPPPPPGPPPAGGGTRRAALRGGGGEAEAQPLEELAVGGAADRPDLREPPADRGPLLRVLGPGGVELPVRRGRPAAAHARSPRDRLRR